MEPDHLFDQADALLATRRGGPLREVDKRRSVSAAYYGLFHHLARAAADLLVSIKARNSPRYVLVYRATDHRRLRALCNEVRRGAPSPASMPYVPAGGFDGDLRRVADIAVALQEARHFADYDPSWWISLDGAKNHLADARSAVDALGRADRGQRQMFLTLLLCAPRG